MTRFFLVLFCFLLFILCSKGDPEDYSKMLATEECNIVVEIPPTSSVWFRVEGYNPITKHQEICKTNNRWWNLYWKEIETGDTLVKKRNELIFSIHKIDTVINHNWNN